MDQELFEQVDQYIAGLLGQEDEALKTAVQSMHEADIPPMNVSANQGKFLQVLAKSVGAKKILELGTCAGYSTIWLARILPADGQVITLEFDQSWANIARRNLINAGISDMVDIRVGKAIEILPQLQAEAPFDFIFIDADKPPYTEYFEWAVKLARKGAIIVADNVVRGGKVLDEDSDDEKVCGVQRLNQSLANNTQVTATIIQNVGNKEHDGMVVAVVN